MKRFRILALALVLPLSGCTAGEYIAVKADEITACAVMHCPSAAEQRANQIKYDQEQAQRQAAEAYARAHYGNAICKGTGTRSAIDYNRTCALYDLYPKGPPSSHGLISDGTRLQIEGESIPGWYQVSIYTDGSPYYYTGSFMPYSEIKCDEGSTCVSILGQIKARQIAKRIAAQQAATQEAENEARDAAIEAIHKKKRDNQLQRCWNTWESYVIGNIALPGNPRNFSLWLYGCFQTAYGENMDDAYIHGELDKAGQESIHAH